MSNRYDEIQLISETPNAHGMFDAVTVVKRKVPCEVKSVGMKEAYQAMSQGLNPSLVFSLALAEDYDDERKLVFHGMEYRIVRTYRNGDGIELTCERVTGDV